MALTREQGFGPEVKRRIILGTYALSSGYYEAYYGQAQKVRTLISRDFTAALTPSVDVLVSPTTPTVAFPLGSRVDDPIAMYAADLCTLPASLAGVPAISVPCGLSDGLPVGLQIMAPALADDRCYRVGRRAGGRPGRRPRPPVPRPAARRTAEPAGVPHERRPQGRLGASPPSSSSPASSAGSSPAAPSSPSSSCSGVLTAVGAVVRRAAPRPRPPPRKEGPTP